MLTFVLLNYRIIDPTVIHVRKGYTNNVCAHTHTHERERESYIGKIETR